MAKQNESAEAVLRKLPAVDIILKEPDLESSAADLGRQVVVDSIRLAIEKVRELILAEVPAETDEDTIRQKITPQSHFPAALSKSRQRDGDHFAYRSGAGRSLRSGAAPDSG